MNSGFCSPLASRLEDFVAQKRRLGFKYGEREIVRLRSFDRFVAEHASGHRFRLDHVIPQWLSRRSRREPNPKRRTVQGELGLVREFCLFLHRRDPSKCSFIPGPELAPPRVADNSRFFPYVFSTKEIRLVLQDLQSTRWHRWPFVRKTFRLLVQLLFCTGLRFGEALRLTLRDVDLRRRVLFINDSKGRSRLVPFHRDLAVRLRAYLEARSQVGRALPDARLFVSTTGRPYRSEDASRILRRRFQKLGLKPKAGCQGPRPYDLRHTFAVHRLTQWYREGVDLHARLPWLSVYMGHVDLHGTEKYLNATPELLQIASRRFAARVRRKAQP
jgi:integrase